MDDKKDPQETLENLRQKHRELHDAVIELQSDPRCDTVDLVKLKKRKLRIKDRIARFTALLADGDTATVLTLIESGLEDDPKGFEISHLAA